MRRYLPDNWPFKVAFRIRFFALVYAKVFGFEVVSTVDLPGRVSCGKSVFVVFDARMRREQLTCTVRTTSGWRDALVLYSWFLADPHVFLASGERFPRMLLEDKFTSTVKRASRGELSWPASHQVSLYSALHAGGDADVLGVRWRCEGVFVTERRVQVRDWRSIVDAQLHKELGTEFSLHAEVPAPTGVDGEAEQRSST